MHMVASIDHTRGRIEDAEHYAQVCSFDSIRARSRFDVDVQSIQPIRSDGVLSCPLHVFNFVFNFVFV